MLKLVGATLIGFLMCAASAADRASPVIRDAEKFAVCMKHMDAKCSVSMMDVATMQAAGAPSSEQLVALTQKRFDQISTASARYTHFTILKSESVFSGDGRLYSFVPYEFGLQFPARGTAIQRGFLVAISRNDGANWLFVEGSLLNQNNIKQFIPSYGGQALPPVSTRHVAPGDEP